MGLHILSGAGGGGSSDPATDAALGTVKLSQAAADPANPVVVEDDDPRNSDQRVSTDASVTNAKVAVGAAIAKSKLGALGIVNADVDAAAAIAKSKLNLTGAITEADLAFAVATQAELDAAVGAMKIARLRRTTTLDLPNNTQYRAAFDTEDEDVGGMANPAATANLTGTVAKTNGAATLTGTGTAFTTELKRGQEITVGGETKMITVITSDTALTVASNWGATQSGVTATRKNNDRFTIPEAGVYQLFAEFLWPNSGSGQRQVIPYLAAAAAPNTWTVFSANTQTGMGLASAGASAVSRPFRAAAGDLVAVDIWQNSGGTLTLPVGQIAELVRLGS